MFFLKDEYKFKISKIECRNLDLFDDLFAPSCFCTIQILHENQISLFETLFLDTQWKDLKKLGDHLKWKLLLISDIFYDSANPQWNLNIQFNLKFYFKNFFLLIQIWDYDEIEQNTNRLIYELIPMDKIIACNGEYKEIIEKEKVKIEIMKLDDLMIKCLERNIQNLFNGMKNEIYTDCIIKF